MERKNLICSAITVIGRSGLSNRAASRRGIRLAPLLLAAVMLAAVAVLAETSNPAQTAYAHDGDDHTHRCTSPPDERCLHNPYGDVGGERTIWSATLTVGTRIFSGTPFLGWDDTGNYTGASLTDQDFTFGGDTYDLDWIALQTGGLALAFDTANAGGIATKATRDKLTPHVGSDSFNLGAGTLDSNQRIIIWLNVGLSWAAGDSVAVKITGPHPPNAYGYRTIWTALVTTAAGTGTTGYVSGSHGKLSNNLIVDGRDETVVIGTEDQPRYPWIGYEIVKLSDNSSDLALDFNPASYPTADEVAGWTLTLGGGVELPFADATSTLAPGQWNFSYIPGWTAGDQVVVSIRNDEVENRVDRVVFKATDLLSGGKVHRVSRHLPAGSRYIYGVFDSETAGGPHFSVPGHTFSLETFEVLTDKTGDKDPVWITATFGVPNEDISWTAYWEGEFEQFHTLFLHWYDNINKRPSTLTLPLRSAAKEGGIQQRGRNVSFVWVRTYKEFERRGLALAKQGRIFADMLAPPQPATARAGGEGGDGDYLQRQYVPTTVTSVDFTSSPGSDQVYGVGDTIQVTVTFSEDVTVGYVGSKRDAAELDLEMDGQTRTAHYARTEGTKVKFEYTVLPGDEATWGLKLRRNSLRLSRDKPSEHGSIRNSSGRDAVLDHNGLASAFHRVDAVGPEFNNAQVFSDGAQVAATFNESIQSPAILRWFGVQTSLLQSLTLDVWVDGDLAVRSGAAVSGDTVTVTVPEPITQGQTVTVSYDNLFIETGESIFVDLNGNNLFALTERPVTNGSTVADVDRPDGGLTLSRTDLKITEGQGEAVADAAA